MILDEGESRVLLDPKISWMKLDDEESSLKWGEWGWSDETEGNINEGVKSSLGSLSDLETEWADWWWMLIAAIKLKELSFNAGANGETDDEMCSCELLISSSVLKFEDLSLNTWDVELNLESFRWVNFDSN